MNNCFSKELFEKMPVVGIMRNVDPSAMGIITRLYLESGFTTLEITMNSENAISTIASLTKKYGEKMNIGAGTVLTLHDLEQALSADAQFIVTPVLNEDIIKHCVQKDIPVFPGAYTPTEIYKAWEMGATMVKVFPASKLGVNYIKEVLAPMRFLKLLPTGGVTLENCNAFLQAGASGVALGSGLFPKEIIQYKDWSELKDLFEQFYHKISGRSKDLFGN